MYSTIIVVIVVHLLSGQFRGDYHFASFKFKQSLTLRIATIIQINTIKVTRAKPRFETGKILKRGRRKMIYMHCKKIITPYGVKRESLCKKSKILLEME